MPSHKIQRLLPLKQPFGLLKNNFQWLKRGKIVYLRRLKPILAAQQPEQLAWELRTQGQHLLNISEQIQVYRYCSEQMSPVLLELGRLREQAFRAVGEGSGQSLDVDAYDLHYQHIILWHKDAREIMAAYRILKCADVPADSRPLRCYSHSLFSFEPSFCHDILGQSAELGRSFVQPKYWQSRSLDYLWQGIGAWLIHNPDVRYLFGPVSLSGTWPAQAKASLLAFYRFHFASQQPLATARKPWPDRYKSQVECTGDYQQDLKSLKAWLKARQLSIPTLFKQYTELCEPGGVHFLDFNLDPQFGNCVDGLVLVDLLKMKASKQQRYLNPVSRAAHPQAEAL